MGPVQHRGQRGNAMIEEKHLAQSEELEQLRQRVAELERRLRRGSVGAPLPDARASQIYEAIPEAVFVADRDSGRLVMVNSEAERLMEMPREELIGMHQSELHPAGEREHYKAIFSEHVSTGRAIGDNLVVQRPDGARVPVKISAGMIELGRQTLIQGVFSDMSAQRQAQYALREVEARNRRLVENLRGYLFYAHDPEGVFDYVSPSVEQILGYTRAEFMKVFTDFLPDTPLNEKAVLHTNLSCQGVEQPPYLVEVLHKDGSLRLLEVTEVPVKDAEGQVLAVEGLAHDLTEKTQLEQQLLASERMAAVGTLAQGVAHEFNNLNASVMGFADLLRGDESLPSGARQYAGRIYKAGLRAAAVTANLLAFAGDQRETMRRGNLVQVVEETLDLMARQLENSGVTLERKLTPVPDTMMVPHQVGQVVLNLLINASHAVMDRPRRVITVETGVKESDLTVTMRDTGIGIPTEDLSKIFSPFYSTKGAHAHGESHQPGIKGTGLGLSLSHTIIEAHAGRILVQSEPGRGSTFTVTLPLVELSGKARKPQPTPTVVAPAATILVLEDEEDIRELLQVALEAEGHTVLTTDDGEEALKLVSRGPVDLALVDLHMPAMDGAEFMRRLAKLELEQAPAVVTISGKVTDETHELMGELGVEAVVTKPFDLPELLALVNGLCGGA